MSEKLTARFIREVTVIDPDTKGHVNVAIFKDNNSCAMFGVDSSFIERLEPDEIITVTEPFNHNRVILTGV